MQLKETHPNNLKELKVEVKKLWVLRMDDSQYLKKLVESMPDGIQEVIAIDTQNCHLLLEMYVYEVCPDNFRKIAIKKPL